jgi:hypothetical protein
MVAMAKKAWFALMNWKTRTGSPRSPVRTRPLPLPRYRAPGAVADSHAADGSAPRARHWSGRPVSGFHRDRPVAPSSRSPGRLVRTRATAPPGCAQIGPDQPSGTGIPVHSVGPASSTRTCEPPAMTSERNFTRRNLTGSAPPNWCAARSRPERAYPLRTSRTCAKRYGGRFARLAVWLRPAVRACGTSSDGNASWLAGHWNGDGSDAGSALTRPTAF